jgi:acetolactate synthase-1/2/3 large subunit
MAGTESDQLPWLHGGDVVGRQLAEEGVRHLFTLTGGHLSPLYDGARFAGIRLIDFRHEQAAVHAADAYARLTRAPAVAALTAGPGVTGGLTGVANAYYANSPTVVLGGRNPFSLDAAGNLQDAPQLELMRPVTKFAGAVYDCCRAPETIREAFRAAMTPRFGPAYVDLPTDVQFSRMAPGEAPPLRRPPQRSRLSADPDLVREAARALSSAKRPLVLAGSIAYWDRAEKPLHDFLAASGFPAVVNGMARGLLGRRHPNQIFACRKQALEQADVVLVLGADFDFRLGYGQPGILNADAAVIQVDPEGRAVGRNRDVTLGIVADTGMTLEQLLAGGPGFAPSPDPGWLDQLRRGDAACAERRRRACRPADQPIHPMHFAEVVANCLDESAVVIGDGGDVVALFAGVFRPGGPGRWLDPGPFGCLGIGVPFAIGARLANPSAPVVVVSGDGAFGFNGFELDSAVRQRLPLVVIVGNDGAWGEMRTFHEDIFGDADTSAQYLSQSTEYETVARGLGAFGQRVERAADLAPAVERALASGGPALVNVILDPAFRRQGATISGKHVALAYGGGDPDAFKRDGPGQRARTDPPGGRPAEPAERPHAPTEPLLARGR